MATIKEHGLMDQPTKASPRRYGRVNIEDVYFDAIFARITSLEQRVKELEAVSVLDVFAGDPS